MSMLPKEEDSFALSLSKNFVLSTATSVGVFAGMIIVGLSIKTVEDLKKKRQAKKAEK